jgi:hypothetical protein
MAEIPVGVEVEAAVGTMEAAVHMVLGEEAARAMPTVLTFPPERG